MHEWFSEDSVTLLEVFLTAALFYLITIAASKVAGIRSFTKTSGFEFLITLAMGALLASTVIDNKVSIMEGTVGLATLYVMQLLIAFMRRKWKFITYFVDSRPILLMENGQFLDKNMKKARITKMEINSKLRGYDIKQYKQVRAVVMEPSGTISVIKEDPEHPLDSSLMEGVRT
ncbi:MAG: DUF421 domain-containing protein [Cyclobacteriaceae bacterium]